MKALYLVGIFCGLGLLVYFYGINFNNMSETELVNSVLYWYVPLTFGLYGLTAYKVKQVSGPEGTGAIRTIFSGKDTGLTILGIIIVVISGVIGFLFFILPMSIFKVKSKGYDIAVAISGAAIWLLGLWFFFFALWPSL